MKHNATVKILEPGKVVHAFGLNTQEAEEGKFKASFVYLWVLESLLRFEIPGVLLDSFPQTDTVISFEIYDRKKGLSKTSWSGGFLTWSASYNLQIDFIWIQKLRKGRKKGWVQCLSVCNNSSSWEVKTKRIRNTGLSLVTGSLRPACMNETLSQKRRECILRKKIFSKIFTDLNALEFISKYPCRNFCNINLFT